MNDKELTIGELIRQAMQAHPEHQPENERSNTMTDTKLGFVNTFSSATLTVNVDLLKGLSGLSAKETLAAIDVDSGDSTPAVEPTNPIAKALSEALAKKNSGKIEAAAEHALDVVAASQHARNTMLEAFRAKRAELENLRRRLKAVTEAEEKATATGEFVELLAMIQGLTTIHVNLTAEVSSDSRNAYAKARQAVYNLFKE